MDKSRISKKWLNIQANMALEGHVISDDDLGKVIEKYEMLHCDKQVDDAIKLAKQSGISLIEGLSQINART